MFARIRFKNEEKFIFQAIHRILAKFLQFYPQCGDVVEESFLLEIRHHVTG